MSVKHKTGAGPIVTRVQLVPRFAAVTVMVVGIFVLLGWAFDVERLKSILPGLVAMNPASAVAFIFAGSALLLLQAEGSRVSLRRVAQVCASIVTMVGVLRLCALLGGLDVHVDQWLFSSKLALAPLGESGSALPNRMAPNTAFNFLLLGGALLLLDVKRGHLSYPFLYCTIAIALTSSLAVIGYIFDSGAFYQVGSLIPMALPTALCFMALAGGILCARPNHGIMAVLTNRGLGGIVARRLLPAVVLVPVVLGWLRLEGERMGLYGAAFGVSLLVTTIIFVFLVLVGWTTNALERSDTVRRQVEQELHDSKARFENIVANTPGAVYQIVLQPDGSVEIPFVNEGCRDLFEMEPEELRRNPTFPIDIVHPDDRLEQDRSVMESVKTLQPWSCEWRIQLPSGKTKWVQGASRPQRLPNGATLWDGLLMDITERKAAQVALQQAKDELEVRVDERTAEIAEAHLQLQEELTERQRTAENLREAQEMLQLVMNHIPQAIFWKDRNSVFLGCNYRLAQDAGYESSEEVIGKTAYEMSSGEHAAAYHADDREVMETDTPKLNIEERSLRADGSQRWQRTNKIPLHDTEGQVMGILGSYEDITEQKEAEVAIHQAREEADNANLAKSEFLSRMSHELRTPLNAILGFGQILERRETDGLGKESVGHILKGGRHLLDLINEVLDITRVEAGRMDLSLEPIALSDVVPDVCALVRTLAAEHGISLNDNLDELSGKYVLADLQRLKQVLINLLSNAIKYNREEGEVEISCEQTRDGWISIAVRDTGLGISAEDLPKLFTPFERLSASSSEIEGTGLGLALSQRLVEVMGGTLSVQSIPGQGTTLTLELPQATAPEEQVTNVPQGTYSLHTNKPTEQLYSVLCIEDNPSNLRLMETIFDMRPDITLLAAIQGSVGLDLARRHEPDLILLDLDLPDIHGSEVLTRLQQSAFTRDIPVVVVSADATHTQIERLMVAGAKGYLTKPLDVGQFLETVEKFLQIKSEKKST